MRSVAHDSLSRELGLVPPGYLSCWSNFPHYILSTGSFRDHHPPLDYSVLLNNLCLVLPSQMHLLDCDPSPIQSPLHPSRAAAPTGWHHHLARPPSPQARPRALCPQATVTIGGHRVAGSFPCRWLLPVGGLGRSRPPLYGAWPWPAATTWGLAVIGRPCRGPGPWPSTLIGGLGRGRPPL
ncbi:hypothetical protein GW17_00042319 [Ensete ventricosum]|nr:hypothetical protein GW17_00042319 [Ensete ventricosum]